VEFDPAGTRAIHHANLKVDPIHSSRWLDDQDPGPGYEGSGARGAKFPDGYFLGWTPGQSPQVMPQGSAWRLEPSGDLIVELHMMPTGRPERVQPRVALYFTDEAPSRLPYMLRLGRQDLDIPAGATRYVSTDSYTLPVDVRVLRVQPHAHWLAQEIRGFATLPDGRVRWLIYINGWDMHWQDVYRLREPMPLPAGTRLTMEYTYDNSEGNVRNPSRPPKRVTFGQTSSSEMGDLWLQVMTVTDADRARLDRDFAPKMLNEDIRGLEKMIEIDARDPRLHADLGLCDLEAGRLDEAVAHLEAAARMQPASPGAQHDAAVALLRMRRFAEARRYLEDAIRLKPDFSEAYSNLGAVLHAEGHVDEAVGLYSRAIALSPDNADAEYNLGRALVARGDLDAALTHYQRSLELKPDDPITLASLASALASRGDTAAALGHYRRALSLDPDLPGALVDLAWILATTERTEIRSPAEAVMLAQRAVTVTGRRSPTALDTLAVAYAAEKDFGRARAAAEEALSLAEHSGSPELADQIRARLEGYRGQP
jgi:tetratricopeptide (TPR) repeat protein